MAGKVVTTSAPSKQETASAKSYVGGAAKQFQGSAKVQEKVGSDASNVNHYRNISAYKATHPGSKYNNYEQTKYDDDIRAAVDRDREVSYLQKATDYITSGQTNRTSTHQWLNYANERAASAKDEDIRNYWANIANDLDGVWFMDNRAEYNGLSKQKEQLVADNDKLKQNRENSSKAVMTGMQPGNFLGDYSDTLKQIQANESAINEIQAKQSALDELVIQRYAPDDVKADYEALKSGKLHGTTLPDLSGMHNPGEDAQARVDEWMQSFGLNQAYFNRFDRAVGGARSAGNSIAGGLEGAVSIVGKALNEADTSDMNVMGAASFTGTTQKNKEDREVRKERIGLPEGQATEDYLAWQNNERYGQGNIDLLGRNTGLQDKDGNLMTIRSMSFNEDGQEILIPTIVKKGGQWIELSDEEAIDWYHKTGEYLGKFNSAAEANAYAEQLHQRQAQIYGGDGNAYEIENAQRLEALLQPEIDALGEQISRLETNHTKASQATSVTANHAALDASVREDKEIRELKRQRQDMLDRLLEAQGLRDKTSFRYKLATDYQNDIFAKMDAEVDTLDKKSQLELLKAKERATSYGKILLDMEKTGLEMGFDMAVGMVTGGSSLAPMFVRVLGNESAAARRDGATLDQQLAYGLTKATIELATEKLFGAFDKIGYGKGIANEMSERIVAKLAETPLGRTIVRAIISAVEEGVEEGLADILGPIADQLYKNEIWKESWDRNMENFWYDVFLGAAMGAVGFGGGVVTGQNRAENSTLYLSELNAADKTRADIVRGALKSTGEITAPEGSLAAEVINASRESGEDSATRQGRIVKMLNDPEQTRLFERETGQTIQGNTIAEKWASVENILSNRTKAENIENEAREQLKAQEENAPAIWKANHRFENIISKYAVQDENGDYVIEKEIDPKDRLTWEEANLLVAAGVIDKKDRVNLALPRGTRAATEEERAKAEYKAQKGIAGYVSRIKESVLTAFGQTKAKEESPEKAEQEEAKRKGDVSKAVKDAGKKGQKESEKMKKAHAKEKAKADVDKSGKIKADSKANENAPESPEKPGNKQTPPKKGKTVKPPVESKSEGAESEDSGKTKKAPAKNKKGDLKPSRLEQSIKNKEEHQKRIAEDKARQTQDNKKVKSAYTNYESVSFPIKYNGEDATATIDATVGKKNTGVITVKLPDGRTLRVKNPSLNKGENFTLAEARSWLYQHRKTIGDMPTDTGDSEITEKTKPEEAEEAPDVDEEVPEEEITEESGEPVEENIGEDETDEDDTGDEIEEELEEDDEDNEKANQQKAQDLAEAYAKSGSESDYKAFKRYVDDYGYEFEVSDTGITVDGVEHKFSDSAKAKKVSADIATKTKEMLTPAPAAKPKPVPAPKAKTANELVDGALKSVETQSKPGRQAYKLIHAIITGNVLTAEEVAQLFSSQSSLKKRILKEANAPFVVDPEAKELVAKDPKIKLLDGPRIKEIANTVLSDLGINAEGYEAFSERQGADTATKRSKVLEQFRTELERYYAGKENNNGVDGTRQESTGIKGEQNVSGGAESQSTSEPRVETENSKLTPRQRSEEAARKSLSGRGITDEGINRLSRVLGAVKSGIGNIVESIKFTRALNTFEDIGKTKYTLVKVADDVMQDGVTDPNVGKDSFGVALFWNKSSQGKLGFTAGHEAGHSRILAFEQLRSAAAKTTVKYTAENIEKAIMSTLPIKERADAMKKITGTFMRGWAEEYLGDVLTEEDFDAILGNENKGIEQLSPEEVISTIESRLLDIDPDGGMLADFQRAIRIEYTNELLVGRSDWFDLAGVKTPVFNRMAIEARKQLVKDGIFDNSSEVTNLVQAVLHLNKESELTPKSAPVKTFNDAVFKGQFGSTMADEAADQEAEKMLEKSAKDVSKFDPKKPVGLYSVRVPTENGETKKEFVVIRNVSPENALRAFINGGEPAPSRAVVKIGAGHTFSGSVSFIYRKSSIDPEVDPRNRTWSGDTYSPLHPGVRDGGATGKLLEAWRGINDRLADFGVDTLPEYKLRRIFHESESIEDFKHDLSYQLKLAFLADMGATRKDVGITLPEVLGAFQSFGGDRVFNNWLKAFLNDSGIEFHPKGTKILEDRDNDSSMLYTLDNALKIMQQQPWVSPAENSSPSELNPPLLTEFHSLEDLKKFTQRTTAFGHTGTLSGGGINTHEFWNFMYSFQDGVFKQARRTWIKEGVFDESDAEGYVKSVFDDWVAAIANKFTNGFDADEFEKIIKEPLYDEWGDEITLPVNDDLRLELKEYLRGVADIPVKFYENKSERVVGSNEIALVLVPYPDTTDLDYFDTPEYKLIEYLYEHNIPYQVYSDTPSSYKMDPLTGELLDESEGYKSRQKIIAEDLGEYVWSKRAPKAKTAAAETGNEVDISKSVSTPHGTQLSKRASDFWFARNVTPKGTKNTSTNKEFDKFNTLGEIHALGGHIDYESVSDVEIGNVAAQNIEMGLKKYGYEAVVEAYKKADPSRTDDLESREIAALARIIDEELWFRMTHDWKASNTSLASSIDILKADYQELSELAQKAANRAAKKLRRTTITTPELDALNNFKQTWAKRDTIDTLDPDSDAAHIIRFGQDTIMMIKDIAQKRAENGYKNEAEAKKAMMDVLKEVNRIRNVQGIFDDSILGKALGNGSRWVEDRLLDKVLKDSDFDTIKMMALGSLNRINSDFQNVMFVNTVNQFRYMNMLSAFMTTMNNFLNNLESATTGAFANNLAYRFLNNKTKKILGEQTLTRSDNDWFKRINIFSETNKDIRRYMTTKGAESALSLLYGLDVDDGKIDINLGAKHNQNSTVLGSNYLGSFMARYQLLTGLKMNTTDAMAMARAYRAQERNIDKLKVSNERKAVLKEAAWQEARRQMYHNEDNFVGKAILKAREGLDKYPIGGQGSSLGLGSILVPFVQVPVNVATRALEATPAGVVYDLAMGGIQLSKLQKQADNYRAAQQAREIKNNKEEWNKLTKEQRDAYEETLEKYGHLSMPTDIEVQKAARMIGHAGANAMSFAVGMLATFMGALRNFDDEDDKELQRLAKEKGYTGLQLNLSAMFNGGKWNDNGDIVIGGGWLEVLAIPLAAGYAVMQSMKGKDSSTDKLKALMKAPATTFKQAIDVVASMPGVDQFYDIWNSYQNLVKYTPDQEERIEKEGNAALQYTASTLASFVIPNAVAATTAGLDNTVREIYNEDTVGKVMGNIFKSKIPGLRQTLRPAIDSTGHVRTYGSNPFMGWLNKAILPGTGIKNWELDELEKEYVRLKEAGVTGELMPRKSAPNYVDVDGERFTYNTEEKRTWDDLNTSLVTAGQQILMHTAGYENMTDAEKGAAMRDVKTLMALVSHQTILDAKEAGVNVELKGWENAYFGNKEDGPDMEGLASYLVAKHTFKPIWDVKNNTFRDVKAADDFITNVYDKLDDTAKETLNSSYAWLDKFSKAKKEAGITAEEFAYIKELQDKYEDAQEAMKDLPDDDARREGTVALNRNMDVEFEDYFGGRNKKSQWAQSNVKLGNWIPASTETMEKWQSKTSLLTREIDSWQDQKASTPVLGGYKELSQNQRFQMIRDFNGITASNQQDLEKKRWDMIEQEASKGDDKDGDGEGDGGAWAKLKPFRDAGYSVAYALEHAVYWYTKDYGKHWQKRSYNKIYPPD